MQKEKKKELLNHFKHKHIKIPITMKTGEHIANRIIKKTVPHFRLVLLSIQMIMSSYQWEFACKILLFKISYSLNFGLVAKCQVCAWIFFLGFIFLKMRFEYLFLKIHTPLYSPTSVDQLRFMISWFILLQTGHFPNKVLTEVRTFKCSEQS